MDYFHPFLAPLASNLSWKCFSEAKRVVLCDCSVLFYLVYVCHLSPSNGATVPPATFCSSLFLRILNAMEMRNLQFRRPYPRAPTAVAILSFCSKAAAQSVDPVLSIVIFFNDYPNNHYTSQFKYILLSTTV